MPTYLLHGFQWPRHLIRIHIILQNLEDAAAEWLVAPATTESLLDNFKQQWPSVMEYLPDLRFVEQYDLYDLTTSSQPYAYVADTVCEVRLGLNVNETCKQSVAQGQREALVKIRDELAPEQEISWFVVVCGDEERYAPSPSPLDKGSWADPMDCQDEEETITPMASSHSLSQKQDSDSSSASTGIKIFGSRIIRKIRSTKDLVLGKRGNGSYTDEVPPPSVPSLRSHRGASRK